jgi:hypothetical protein
MDPDEGGGEKKKEIVHISEPTLLPAPVANIVSLVTRSSSLYLQLGTFIGGLAISGARITTLTGLEISRALIEGILHRAGRDVSERSIGEIGRAEADGMLERSIATLHSTITSISFAASTGFHLSSTILSSAGDLSQQLLVSLDSILGSTDSSRAIASIITLIRREFQNPATGQEGEKVGVGDLLVGICGLALLQRWCRKITDAESREGRYEEVVWDVVILDDGRRADVVANDTSNQKSLARANSMSFVTPGGNEVVQTIEREGRLLEESDDDLPEINLKRKIMKSLPANSSVSITTETNTTKTITVDITGAQPSDLLSPPPGVEIIEKNALDGDYVNAISNQTHEEPTFLAPKYRVVYRVTHHKTRGTNIGSQISIEDAEEAIEVSDDEAPSPISKDTLQKMPDIGMSPIASLEKDLPSPPLKARNFSTSSVKSVGSSQSTESADTKPTGLSSIPLPKGLENVANQKRSRKPMSSSSSINGADPPPPQKKTTLSKPPPSSKSKSERPPAKGSEKKGSFRNALKKGSSNALSHMWSKESSPDASSSKSATSKPAWGVPNPSVKSHIPVPQRNSSITPLRDAPRPPQRGNPNYFSSRDLGLMQPADIPRSQSRTSYYSVHEQRRDSMVSQTDTYSIHSAETRPGSPTAFRTHLKTQSSIIRARSEKNMTSQQPGSPSKHHRRSRSYVPSIYTLKTNNSAQSLVLSRPRRSAFEDLETIENMMRTGFIDGLFPQHHIVRNISRFVRFASASYGSHFLRVMGITSPKSPTAKNIDTSHHHEHHSFSTHTQLPPDTILLSSFFDPQGGTDSTGLTNTGVPMVHFVSLDHESKAVVLTCRGTLGFEDVLTDMTCDYDELMYCGKAYKVHKGIHASARRLLDGGGGRVMATIAASLEEFPDYGLVLCGHSLGGGVTALLAILISEPSADPGSTAFFTAANQQSPQLLLTSSNQERSTAPSRIHLPAGRPVHVYAYGPPATLSPSLRLATRGLITTIVNGQDLVPFLSLGVLHDLQAVALAFKTDDSGAKGEFRKRVVAGITGALQDKWYAGGVGGVREDDDDQWAYSALKALRASMLSVKLLPPGEVFIVEAMPVLQRDAFVRHDEDGGGVGRSEGRGLGRPATRSVLKYVRDVEKKFGEVRFGGSMLLDHSPGRYEGSLGALARGVLI